MISPELQETAIRDHCARNGYDVVDVVTDLDITGRFWKRRQVDRVVGMIEQGAADVLVVWKVSRVARNRLDWNIALDRVETVGGRLESATEPIDTTTSSGRFARGILGELAAFESERIGEGWQEAHQRRWRNGLPHTGRNQWGYTYERGVGYSIDPDLAPIVRETYERFIAGAGHKGLLKWLHSLGVEHFGDVSSLRQWLPRGFPAGLITHHDPACQLPHPRNSPSKCRNVIREPGAHEPIITEDTFAEYTAELARRGSTPPRLRTAVSPVSGIVICTRCGCRMTRRGHASAAKPRAPQFACRNGGRVDRVRCTAPAMIKESAAIEAVVAWLATVADEFDARATAKRRDPSAADVAEREQLERTATRAEAALVKLTLDFARGVIPESAYRSAVAALESERDVAAAAAARFARTRIASAERAQTATRLIAAWPTLSSEGQNRVLRDFCVVKVTRSAEPRTPATIEVRGVWEA